jgi:hypothetical protein
MNKRVWFYVFVMFVFLAVAFVTGCSRAQSQPQGVGMPPTTVARWCVAPFDQLPIRARKGLCPTGSMSFRSDAEALLWMKTLKILPREKHHATIA